MGLDNKQNNNVFARPQRPKIKKKRSRTISEASVISDISLARDSENESIDNPVKSKKKRIGAYNANEESRLEKLVFGDPTDVIKNLESDNEEVQRIIQHNVKDKASNYSSESSDTDENDSVILMKSDNDSIITVDSKISVARPAWQDEDDEVLTVKEALISQNRRLPNGRPEVKYNELLQNKFTHIVGTPKWAKLDREIDEDSEDSDNELLKHSNHLIPNKSKSLAKGTIDLKVLAHVNKQTHTEGPFVNSVQFHKLSTVALVAGSSGVLSLFEIDGRENNKLHTMKFERFPIHTARFLQEGSSILVGSGKHAYCHSYDLMTGKTFKIPLPHGITNMKNFEVSPDGKLIAISGRFGEVYLLSSITKELIGMIQMNKKCQAFVFTPDSTKIITHGDSSELYTWDIGSRSCLNRAFDDGCLSGSSIAMSPNGQFVATGSKQGAVNLYDANSIINERAPMPVKTVLNLVTSITKLKFNSSTEILAIASEKKETAFKMLHLPSFHVFSNFPTFNTTMFNPVDMDFSPASGYLSISNNKGFAYLYRLKHYGNY
ncbi:PREDICTED: U3 small nucleolar RNA-associated protein 18 homolog [Ceratosolen solmsi marchali]|uniref:U3 small nucleolar RNA-associated protein 18 homolog n=1 Tax=Ceratosolen solmsi marchali TaxID=326594 RepID=A0AAJ6YV36_9HYME|nr:PREDICTED: U3 small nucleolar RNA-associated protein 18 homolog [Ceratosolen solmsi marchali]